MARAYLGMSVPGFPNLFLLYGPNTNGGTGSVIYTIEAGMSHVIAALRELAAEHMAHHPLHLQRRTIAVADKPDSLSGSPPSDSLRVITADNQIQSTERHAIAKDVTSRNLYADTALLGRPFE